MREAKIFEEIYQDYLEKALNLDPLRVRDRLGIEIHETGIVIPY